MHRQVQPSPQSILEHFHHLKKKTPLLTLAGPSPSPHPWAVNNLLSIPTDFSVLDISL